MTASAPNLDALLNSVDLLTVLRGLGHQFDFVFEKLDRALDKFLSFELPLVGVRLDELPAFGFFDDLVSVGSSALSGELDGSFTFASVRSSLATALQGLFAGSQVTQFPLSPTNQVEYTVTIGDTITQTIPMKKNLGFAALDLDIAAGVDVTFHWAFSFTMGANLTDGVYFNVAQTPELQVDLEMSLAPGTLVTGTLGFYN